MSLSRIFSQYAKSLSVEVIRECQDFCVIGEDRHATLEGATHDGNDKNA